MLLSAHDISKYHNEKCILNKVSFALEEQHKIALIGVNGTGKTTFLDIIAGRSDYEGEIIRKKECRIAYLAQQPQFDENLSVIEQIEKKIAPRKVALFEIRSILTKLAIEDETQMLKTMSGGQQKRVALAIALLQPCDLLILDEPTNHLDNQMIEWLEKYLMKCKHALLMVTHDRYFLDAITNQVWEIDQGQVFSYEGNYSSFIEAKIQREEVMVNQEKKRHAFLRKEIEWVRAGVQARGTKSKKRLENFYALSNQEKLNRQKEVEMFQLSTRLGKKTIELKQLSMQFEDHHLFSDFSYHFKQNERVGILGVNGSGKSSLLNILSGELVPTQGSIEYGETVRIGYFKQGCGDMDENSKVIDYIKQVSDDMVIGNHHFSAKQMLERFLFDAQIQYTQIRRLSGGEKRRLYLLKVLMEAPNVLLLDEPTNDLDIMTLQILEDYLDHFQGIIICVSHDRYFLDRICEALFVFANGNLTTHIGGYSSYIDMNVEKEKKSDAGALRYEQQKQWHKNNRLSMTSKEKNELLGMEVSIMDIETEIAQLDEDMEINAECFELVSALSAKRSKLEQLLDEKCERFMYLLDLEEQVKKAKEG